MLIPNRRRADRSSISATRRLWAALVGIVLSLTVGGLAMAKTWATATSKNQTTGRVIIFRFIQQFDPGFKRSDQPVRVILVWKYKGSNGMPVFNDRERMDAMEDLLAPAVESDGFSSLALVSTGEDLREWIYYAKSEDDFLARMNKALSGHTTFPIKVHSTNDPTWSNYQNFVDGMRK